MSTRRAGLVGRVVGRDPTFPARGVAGAVPQRPSAVPRWRWVLWFAGIANGLTVAAALSTWPQRGAGMLPLYGGGEPAGVFGALYAFGFFGGLLAVLAGVASLVVRFRRARYPERAQVRLLLAAIVTVVVAFSGSQIILTVLDIGSEQVADLFGLVLVVIPVTVGVAVLRYRLYDVDRLISRTLAYTLLTTVLAAVYTVVVVVSGQLLGGVDASAPIWVVASATLAMAGVFQPARLRIQRAVDRRFNRRRYDAAKTIEAFSAQLRDELELDALTAQLYTAIAEMMQQRRVRCGCADDRIADRQNPRTRSPPGRSSRDNSGPS